MRSLALKWYKKFSISKRNPIFKVRYLGNVMAARLTKRDDSCIETPAAVVWKTFQRHGNSLKMTICVCPSGLRVETAEQGSTEYLAHRIAFCATLPSNPRIFVWVYRHETRTMRFEQRCHVALCKTASHARALTGQLRERIAEALAEYQREKSRRHQSRIVHQRFGLSSSCPTSANSSWCGTPDSAILTSSSSPSASPTRRNQLLQSNNIPSGLNARIKFLSTGRLFKPPAEKSISASPLCSITEDIEAERRPSLDAAKLVRDLQRLALANLQRPCSSLLEEGSRPSSSNSWRDGYRWRNSCDSIASEVIPTTSELRQSSSQPDLRPDDEEIRFRIDYRTIELSKSEKKLSSYTTSVIQNDVDVCDDVFDDIKTQQKTIPSISRKSFAASRYKVDSLSAESGIAEMLSSVSPSPTNNDDRMTSAGM